MTASELFKAGKLNEAVAAQTQEVKNNPGDPGRRLFLFELLAFAGDLERARRQIEAVAYDDMERNAAVAEYRRLLDSEEARRALFRDGTPPRFLAEPPEHVRLRLEAVGRLRAGQTAEAAALLEQAASASPPVRGELNGKSFASLRDCDELFGPVLEVFAKGQYFWVPLEQVASLALDAPRFPRDLIWAPARLEMADGSEGAVYLPVLYPQSYEHADDQVKLGRVTLDWTPADDGPIRGAGQHLFLVGEEEIGVLEWRQLQVQSS